MAHVRDNVLLTGISGTIAKLVTFSLRGTKTIIGKGRRKKRQSEPNEVELAIRARFTTSIAYAKIAVKDPATKALYQQAATPDQTAANVAFRDAYIAPKVDAINATAYHGAVGDTITIRATDDFKVTEVSVSIHDATGTLIEQGTAIVQPNEADWVYKSTQSNATLAGSKISAVAKDLPGNTGSLEITL